MNFFQKLISLFLSFIYMLAYWGSGTKPEIKEGEFDFILTYEVDGEIGTIEGTYVCKFEKVEYFIDGVDRQWTGYIKGHEHDTSYALKTTDEGIIKVELDLSAEYFMADPFYDLSGALGTPEASLLLRYNEDIAPDMGYFSTDPELIAEYGVKIISCEYDEPIENVYE